MRWYDVPPFSHLPELGKRQRTSAYIADSIREAIRYGELEDGTELSQVALAAHFGVSRVPVREALFQLQAEGWITSKPHHPAVVRALSREGIVEAFNLRILLETHLVELAIANITAEQLDALDRRCNEMERITDRHEWLAANNAFHFAIYETSGATMTIGLLEQITSLALRYVRGHGGAFARAPQAGAEHQAILAAIRRRDVKEARRLLRAHIEETRDYVIRSLKSPSIMEANPQT